MSFEMKKSIFIIMLFVTQGVLFGSPQEDIISLSKHGNIKKAIGKYHDYYLQKKEHNPKLVEEIFLGFLRNESYARQTSQIIVSEVAEGKRNKDETIKIFQKLLDFPDTVVKVNAAKFLILLGYKERDLLPALKEGLHDEYGAGTTDAALLLGSLKCDESLSLLEEGLKNPDLAIVSVWGLVESGGERATSLLISGLRDSRIKGGEEWLEEELSKLDETDKIWKLTNAWVTRLECAKGLAKAGGKDAILALGEALGLQDEDLKREALIALGEIALVKEIEGRDNTEITAIPYIQSALKDKTLKKRAAKILCKLEEKDGIDFFKEQLMKGTMLEKIEAASLLAKIEDY